MNLKSEGQYALPASFDSSTLAPSAAKQARMRDPNTVAAIVNILRQVHGDDIARVMLNDGISLAVLIDAVWRSPLKNGDAVKLVTRALSSGDFFVTPDFGAAPSQVFL